MCAAFMIMMAGAMFLYHVVEAPFRKWRPKRRGGTPPVRRRRQHLLPFDQRAGARRAPAREAVRVRDVREYQADVPGGEPSRSRSAMGFVFFFSASLASFRAYDGPGSKDC